MKQIFNKLNLTIFSLFLLQFLPQKVLAYEPNNDELVGGIERALLFDKDSNESIDFYKTDSSKKPVATIGEKPKTSEESSEDSGIKAILVEDKRTILGDIRQKEKMAYNYSLIGQYEVAIQLLKSVLAVEPDNNYSNFTLASIYQKIGQNRQAKEIYYQLLKSDFDNKEQVIINLLLIISEQSPREAIATTKRLISQNPNKDYLYNIAGQSYEKIGDLDNSIQMFKKAYEINEENPKYAYNLAIIYDRAKKYDLAFNYYDRALSVATDDIKKHKDIPVDQIKARIQQIKELI